METTVKTKTTTESEFQEGPQLRDESCFEDTNAYIQSDNEHCLHFHPPDGVFARYANLADVYQAGSKWKITSGRFEEDERHARGESEDDAVARTTSEGHSISERHSYQNPLGIVDEPQVSCLYRLHRS